MDNKISTDTKVELLTVLKTQYRKSSKMQKTKILDQFIAVSGYHRKHAIRLLQMKLAAVLTFLTIKPAEVVEYTMKPSKKL